MASSTGSIMLKREDRSNRHWLVYYDNGLPGAGRRCISRAYDMSFNRRSVERAVLDLCAERGLPEPRIEWQGGDMAFLYPKDAG